MIKDEHLNLVLKKKELWLKGNNCFNESARLAQDLHANTISTNERIEQLKKEGRKFLDEMQELDYELLKNQLL